MRRPEKGGLTPQITLLDSVPLSSLLKLDFLSRIRLCVLIYLLFSIGITIHFPWLYLDPPSSLNGGMGVTTRSTSITGSRGLRYRRRRRVRC